VSGLRENFTSRSDGEGLETGPWDSLRHRHEAKAAGKTANPCILTSPRQSFTRQLVNWELKSGLGLGQHQVSGDQKRSTNSVGIAVLAYLFLLRACHHEITPGQSWSIFQLQHGFQLRTMTNQVEHNGKVKMAKGRKAA